MRLPRLLKSFFVVEAQSVTLNIILLKSFEGIFLLLALYKNSRNVKAIKLKTHAVIATQWHP